MEQLQNTSYAVWQINRGWFVMDGELWYIYRRRRRHAPNEVTNVLVHNTLNIIPHFAFHLCRHLRYVYVPDSVTWIQGHAFYKCNHLKSVILPNSVLSMQTGVFWGCSRLENVIIPNRLTRIPPLAFAGCKALTRIDIPPSVTVICPQAFRSCKALAFIKLPKSVYLIGNDVFRNCIALKAVELPIYVRLMDARIFKDCPSLRTITLYECNSTTDDSNNNMHIVLDTKFMCNTELVSIKMPNITTAALWPHLLNRLQGEQWMRRISVGPHGRMTAVFSFLQQNMHHILEMGPYK
jgi:hypothetical protein